MDPNKNQGQPGQQGEADQGGGVSNRPLDREQNEQDELPPRGRSKDDVGRTTGGGSLGHDQPAEVKRDSPARNATGSDDDPVMPRDDATLKTKI